MTQTLAAPTPETPSTAGDSPQEPNSGGNGGFWSRLFGSGETPKPSPAAEPPASKSDEPTADEGTPEGEQPPKAATAEPESDDWKPAASREEEARRIQAESDRREEKRKRDEDQRLRQEASQAQNARLQALEREEEEAVNDGDLDRVREIKGERRQILAQVRQGQFVSGLIGSFDQHMLLPLLSPLPQAEQERIVGELRPMAPLEGRKHAVEQTLKLLEKQWRSDEATKTKARLKTDDAFWRELRASRGFEEDEPDHVPGSPSGNGSGDVNTQVNQSLLSLIQRR